MAADQFRTTVRFHSQRLNLLRRDPGWSHSQIRARPWATHISPRMGFQLAAVPTIFRPFRILCAHFELCVNSSSSAGYAIRAEDDDDDEDDNESVDHQSRLRACVALSDGVGNAQLLAADTYRCEMPFETPGNFGIRCRAQ